MTAKLSAEARDLLCCLAAGSPGMEPCVGEYDGDWYVIPSPTYNWDCRDDLLQRRLKHPECLLELAESGLLVFGEPCVTNWESPHSRLRGKTSNMVYTLAHEMI